MPGKIFKESTGESETGGQNEPIPGGQPPLGEEVVTEQSEDEE